MKKLLPFLMIALMVSWPALALDLHTARAQGLVGEKADGYIAAIKPAPDIETLVREVNAKRHEEYARIAKQKSQSVDVVAKLAAAQLISKLGSGQMYQDESGAWKKR
jgi:uncharacterized protein